MALKSLHDAFVHELEDILNAEHQITRALPKMIDAAHDKELRSALERHLRETERQIERVEKAFESLNQKPGKEACEGMEGLIEEGEEVIDLDAEPDVKDALLIGAAQKVEHYEIASYGTLCTWAEIMGHEEALHQLKQNLAEEKHADEKLMEVARSVNQHAIA